MKIRMSLYHLLGKAIDFRRFLYQKLEGQAIGQPGETRSVDRDPDPFETISSCCDTWPVSPWVGVT